MRFAKRNKLYLPYGDQTEMFPRTIDKTNPYVVRGFGGRARRVRCRRYDVLSVERFGGADVRDTGRDKGLTLIGEVGPTHSELTGACYGGDIRTTIRSLRHMFDGDRRDSRTFRALIEELSQRTGSL